MREGDDLDGDEVAEALADRQHGMEVPEAELVVDVDVAAHVQRAGGHDLLHQVGAGLGLGDGAGGAHLALGLDAVRHGVAGRLVGTQGRPSRVLSRWMCPSTSGGKSITPGSPVVGGRRAAMRPSLISMSCLLPSGSVALRDNHPIFARASLVARGSTS